MERTTIALEAQTKERLRDAKAGSTFDKILNELMNNYE